jgi:hypothetical protein
MKKTGILLPTISQFPCGVELDGEPAHVSGQIHRARPPCDSREAHEDLGLLSDVGQHLGCGELCETFRQLEHPVRSEAAGVNHALGNTFVVKMEDFFAQDEIFKQGRPARPRAKAVLIITDGYALLSGHGLARALRLLVRFAAVADGLLKRRGLQAPWAALAP